MAIAIPHTTTPHTMIADQLMARQFPLIATRGQPEAFATLSPSAANIHRNRRSACSLRAGGACKSGEEAAITLRLTCMTVCS